MPKGWMFEGRQACKLHADGAERVTTPYAQALHDNLISTQSASRYQLGTDWGTRGDPTGKLATVRGLTPTLPPGNEVLGAVANSGFHQRGVGFSRCCERQVP